MNWRTVGINYIRYSELAAKALRDSLKPHLKIEAQKREGSTIRFTRWKDGKALKKESAEQAA